MTEAIANPAAVGEVALVSIKGNFMFDPATHRDFLGAALGTGVQRTQVGLLYCYMMCACCRLVVVLLQVHTNKTTKTYFFQQIRKQHQHPTGRGHRHPRGSWGADAHRRPHGPPL